MILGYFPPFLGPMKSVVEPSLVACWEIFHRSLSAILVLVLESQCRVEVLGRFFEAFGEFQQRLREVGSLADLDGHSRPSWDDTFAIPSLRLVF